MKIISGFAVLAIAGFARVYAADAPADGAQLYQTICQSCHMKDARGAVGAATIPALAGDARLASTGYPLTVVLQGYGAMPAFGGWLSDAQIAAVINHVRTHFENHYTDAVTAKDVTDARVPGQQYSSGTR